MRTAKPCHAAEPEDEHWSPFQEDGQDRQFGFSTRLDDVIDAGRKVSEEERGEEKRYPSLLDSEIQKFFGQLRQEKGWQNRCQWIGPDGRSKVSRSCHEEGSDEKTFGRAVEDAQIQRVGVVCLPGAEEHRQAWNHGCESAGFRCAETQCGGLQK